MRTAEIFVHDQPAGILKESDDRNIFTFTYLPDYDGPPVSLTMPIVQNQFTFRGFPPFFEGLLPEGIMLEGMLRRLKIDKNDYFSQLMATGKDLVGAVTCVPVANE
ncbi:MAG TPA: HipA N-terminal domain-containing protein [Flavilitoribacter sp.]|nr:HipA N-terminal domain-containing protein [Flavilitoribacter sp.]HMQ88820.1 HipA N-terminal domain-containing protein [Flavilitoribacter sp.]